MSDFLIFDSYPIISFLREEKGFQIVEDILKAAIESGTHLVISPINWGEVYYIVFRTAGEIRAKQALRWMDIIGFQLLSVTSQRVLHAARIKARFPVSYADAFAIAAAQELDCPVVTGDPEFRRVEQAGVVKVMWVGGEKDQ